MQINSIQDVAATVQGRRQELGLSQAELATRAGVSRDWVNQIEAGKATAEFGLVIRLLDALGLRLDIDVRASGDDTPTGGSVDLDALLDEYREQ
jgi:HTH-type transcriptional regulator/antitoxin HipB